jgi:LytS/YehU family sensor histidine kinase
MFPPNTPFLDWAVAPRAVLDFAFALLAWSAAYFGVVLWQDTERHERAIADAQRAAEESGRLAREAQLEALAYQLNPHFLFNALSSLRALIDEDPARARRMVTELAGFFRYTMLERPLHTATLGDEIAALRDYLAIERIRFGERLVVEIDVNEAAQGCVVPAFLVHPLVENALKHGGGARPGATLELSIRAAVQGDRLAIAVWNTGELRDVPSDGSASLAAAATRGDRSPVGLRNVRARLERMYPESHAFTLAPHAGGVLARVELPCMAPTDAAAAPRRRDAIPSHA